MAGLGLCRVVGDVVHAQAEIATSAVDEQRADLKGRRP